MARQILLSEVLRLYPEKKRAGIIFLLNLPEPGATSEKSEVQVADFDFI
jgi:hypothetical protein